MEFGPRALGNRSILGDARSPNMQSVMNLKVKFRESFRPFAPVVRRERVADYFELDTESPYMLLVAPVRTELRKPLPAGVTGIELLKAERSTLPAITHVDYSARIQTVARDGNPLLYDLLLRFERATGCGVLVNTSFNVRGEPIVCTPEDAYRCFVNTEMDYLIMGSFVIERTANRKQIPARRDCAAGRLKMKPNLKDEPKEWRKSALMTALGLAIFSSVLRWRHILTNDIWLGVARAARHRGDLRLVATALVSGLSPTFRRGSVWPSASSSAGSCSLFFFFFILTPVGLILRLAGKDALQLRPLRAATTYWQSAKDYGPLDRLF